MSKDRKWAPTHNTGKKGRMRLQAAPPRKMAKINAWSCSPAPPSGGSGGGGRGGERRWEPSLDLTPGAPAPGDYSQASWGCCGILERCQLEVRFTWVCLPTQSIPGPLSFLEPPYSSCEGGGDVTLPGSRGVSSDCGAEPPHVSHTGFSPSGVWVGTPKAYFTASVIWMKGRWVVPLVSRSGYGPSGCVESGRTRARILGFQTRSPVPRGCGLRSVSWPPRDPFCVCNTCLARS